MPTQSSHTMKTSTLPTILLITADEMNREALSCYGATSHATPHLDRLAQGGLRFDAAYASSPACLPSRCSIATGLYPHHNLSLSNGTGRSLDRRLPNIFTQLGQVGYRVSKHGKCHFIPVPYAYNVREFTREYEHFIHYYRSLGIEHLDLMDDPQVSAWYYDDYAKDMERQGLLAEFRRCIWECHDKTKEFPTPGTFRFPGPDHMHPDSWVGERALDYIRAYEGLQPAFIWTSFGGPHYPACAPQKYYDLIDMAKDRPRRLRPGEWDDQTKGNAINGHGGGADGDFYAPARNQGWFDERYWRDWRHAYYASCVQIDDYIGRIVAAAEQKWGDNLLIVFAADHGDMMGDHGFWGKCPHEQGVRVPLLLRLPGGERAGTHTGAMVQLVDILPTLVTAAGGQPAPCDGRPLTSLIDDGGRRFALSEHEDFLLIKDRRFKYVERRKNNRLFRELYDLENDPDEFENIYHQAELLPGYEPLRLELERLDRERGLRNLIFHDPARPEPPYWAKLES